MIVLFYNSFKAIEKNCSNPQYLQHYLRYAMERIKDSKLKIMPNAQNSFFQMRLKFV